MNPLLMHSITVSETFSAHIKAFGKQPCSNPVLLDQSTMADPACLNETALTAWLNEAEREQFRQFTLKKRQKEWLAGRICAKIAIKEYFSTYCRDRKIPACTELSIVNSDTGRPFALWNTGERLHEGPDISISHSGSLALALAARTCCGVDIQKARDTLIRVKARFCTDREEHLMLPAVRRNAPLLHLALLWAAKEAARKALSISDMPGFLDLVLTGVEKIGPEEKLFILERSHRHARIPLEIRVITTCYQDYGLGVCIP